MLSICIPIYNVRVKALVEALLAQANTLDVPSEIILIDDSSTQEFVDENTKLKAANLTYLGLHENIGRAKIRNMFDKAAQYSYLLFLDCDSEMVSPAFLKDYINQAKKGEKVVCGGRVYSKQPPSKDTMLHWKYGISKESKPASERMQHPYRSFMTNNFLIEKKVFESIQFDERLSGYGHEDTLFGYELKKAHIPITHIDNPILHAELQTNKEFLEKSENAVSNLKSILGFVNNDPLFIEDVTLLRYYNSLKKTGLLFIVKMLFFIKRPILKSWFSNGFSNMAAFDFYKLGYLASVK